MNKPVTHISVFVGAIAVIAFFSSLFIVPNLAQAGSSTTVVESTTTTSSDTEIDVETLMRDRVLGDADAPVTVIEYASMTCMHCAEFHNAVLPTLKKDLIDTGKVRFVFREFPLDAVALRASMMARCAPEDKFSGLIEVLFANQKRWVGAEDPIAAMSKLGKLTGMSDARINACLSNSDLETAVLKSRQDASANYKVSATPTFVFNGGAEVESGVIPADDFKDIVEKLSR